MMYVQYSFVSGRKPTAVASAPVELSPSLTVWAGILAMIATIAAVALG
jgi:hypothetical protein